MRSPDQSDPLAHIIQAAGQIILGKERPLGLALACLLARGHLLIEDLPGMGKTTLAHALAKLVGLDFQRMQFTSDMLPADILGGSVFDRETGAFRFHPGPIFAQVVLADEVNRATPKTQSALLEAMEERQVTTEGQTRPLPDPFFVIASQNPSNQVGTLPLPESQLDRFLMKIELGYPDRAAERELLGGSDRREMLAGLYGRRRLRLVRRGGDHARQGRAYPAPPTPQKRGLLGGLLGSAPPEAPARPSPHNPLEGAGTYAFMHETKGWIAEDLCRGYILTEPGVSSALIEASDVERLSRLAAVPDRDLPPALAAQVEMARFSRAG